MQCSLECGDCRGEQCTMGEGYEVFRFGFMIHGVVSVVGGWQVQCPQTIAIEVAGSLQQDFIVEDDLYLVVGKQGVAAGIAQLADGDQGRVAEIGEDVCGPGCRGKPWDWQFTDFC